MKIRRFFQSLSDLIPRFYNCRDIIYIVWNGKEYYMRKW